MIIDINAEMNDHFQRVRALAEEAADDVDQGFSSRASAMTAVTTMLVQLTKAQESIIMMENLMKVEQTIVDTVKEFLTEEQLTHVIEALERNLARL